MLGHFPQFSIRQEKGPSDALGFFAPPYREEASIQEPVVVRPHGPLVIRHRIEVRLRRCVGAHAVWRPQVIAEEALDNRIDASRLRGTAEGQMAGVQLDRALGPVRPVWPDSY